MFQQYTQTCFVHNFLIFESCSTCNCWLNFASSSSADLREIYQGIHAPWILISISSHVQKLYRGCQWHHTAHGNELNFKLDMGKYWIKSCLLMKMFSTAMVFQCWGSGTPEKGDYFSETQGGTLMMMMLAIQFKSWTGETAFDINGQVVSKINILASERRNTLSFGLLNWLHCRNPERKQTRWS